MFRLWIEWDFGQENIVFSSQQKAIDWFNGLKIEDENDELLTYEALNDDGLASIQELTVV
jgi:hypothetical protein